MGGGEISWGWPSTKTVRSLVFSPKMGPSVRMRLGAFAGFDGAELVGDGEHFGGDGGEGGEGLVFGEAVLQGGFEVGGEVGAVVEFGG